jgi:hypothetical protein
MIPNWKEPWVNNRRTAKHNKEFNFFETMLNDPDEPETEMMKMLLLILS